MIVQYVRCDGCGKVFLPGERADFIEVGSDRHRCYDCEAKYESDRMVAEAFRVFREVGK